ncbi:MAG: aldehyde ferredoxin oxidoreductase family protein [Thermodesulfobacteriota bacterium]
MWYGWTGNVLRVDLSQSLITIEELDRPSAEKFIGGRGLGVKYLYDEIDPAIDALSPKNKLIFATGPLTGTGAPGASRYMVVCKGPLTGLIAESSAGGAFSTAMKYAGYDLIILEGRAARPVYLWVDDDQVAIREAGHIWGKATTETVQAVIKETHPEAKVACIGPAGENQVLFACVMSDEGRAAGRSGVGAVMGSKNLKAVAVHGTRGVKVADKAAFLAAVDQAYRKLDTESTEHFHQVGTPFVTGLANESGVLPTRNYQTGVNKNVKKLSAEFLAVNVSVRKNFGLACPACPVACRRISRVSVPEFAGQGDGPEYETIGLLGSSCDVNDLYAVTKANFICNEMGMDTISAGSTIACAMELYEKGYLPLKDAGTPLNFGNAQAVIKLVEDIGLKRGFGAVLAEGSYRVAKRYGHPEFHMGTKKLEFASYDPRGVQGQGLAYATNSRGGCHIRGEVQDVSLFGVNYWRVTKDHNLGPVDPLRWDDQPPLTVDVQDYFCLIDSSGMCNFMFFLAVDEDDTRLLIETATGINMGGHQGFMRTGERIFNLERLFNLKAGLTGREDTLPKRMLEEPMPEGPAKGLVVHLGEMLPQYYQLRGWTPEGVPTRRKIEELGLSE